MKIFLPLMAIALSSVAMVIAVFFARSTTPAGSNGGLSESNRELMREMGRTVDALEKRISGAERDLKLYRSEMDSLGAAADKLDSGDLDSRADARTLSGVLTRLSSLEERISLSEEALAGRDQAQVELGQIAQRLRSERSSGPSPSSLADLRVTAVDGESVEKKLSALRALRGTRDEDGNDGRSHDVVLSMIDIVRTSEDASVRADVYRQLSGVTDPSLLDSLFYSLANDTHFKVREEAAETLSDYLPDPEVERALEQAAENDENEKVRQEAYKSLRKRHR